MAQGHVLLDRFLGVTHRRMLESQPLERFQ
jgi:hypothetical protein